MLRELRVDLGTADNRLHRGGANGHLRAQQARADIWPVDDLGLDNDEALFGVGRKAWPVFTLGICCAGKAGGNTVEAASAHRHLVGVGLYDVHSVADPGPAPLAHVVDVAVVKIQRARRTVNRRALLFPETIARLAIGT